MENHFARFENRKMQECLLGTMWIDPEKRSMSFDHVTGNCVALLDQYLQFSGCDALNKSYKIKYESFLKAQVFMSNRLVATDIAES